MAARYAAGAAGPSVRRAAWLRRHRPGGAHGGTRHDHLPVHRRAARPRCRRCTRTSRSSTLSAPTARATCRSGGSSACRRRPSWRPTGRSSPSRSSSTSSTRAPAPSCCRRGCSPPCARCPAGAHPSFAMGYSVRDNDFYRAWDSISPRSRLVHVVDRPVRARHRWSRLVSEIVIERRPDDRQRRPRAGRAGSTGPAGVLRRHRPALARRRTWPAGCTTRRPCSSTSRAASVPSPTACRCRSATASSADTADAVVGVPEIFTYWLQAGGSTSGSSAVPNSTASPTSTRR